MNIKNGNNEKRKPDFFSNRKVSPEQAIKLLKQNGIQVNEDQVIVILDFLYLLARTYSKISNDEAIHNL